MDPVRNRCTDIDISEDEWQHIENLHKIPRTYEATRRKEKKLQELVDYYLGGENELR